jgi:hypothetical protein
MYKLIEGLTFSTQPPDIDRAHLLFIIRSLKSLLIHSIGAALHLMHDDMLV